MSVLVKICGLSTAETVEAAIEAGADMIGLVFHPKSPRCVGFAEATSLASQARGRALVVALTVDDPDERLAAIVEAASPDLLQVHGTETPGRVGEIKARFGLPVMRAIGIAGADDLGQVARWRGVADRLLLDAKAPAGANYPGGHGRAFDWSLLADLDRSDLDPAAGFMLSGGLDPANVAAAISAVRPAGVDVSSGVETTPGVKDPAAIRAFVAAARRAAAALA